MKKSISKVLTLMLSFAMVFTSIVWFGASEVNAAEGQNTLSINVVDENGDPVKELPLYVDNDDGGAVEFAATSETGETSHTFDWTVDGIYGEMDEYTVSLSTADEENWEITQGVVFSVVFDESTLSGYIDKVNGTDYDGSKVTLTLKAKGGEEPGPGPEPEVLPAVADFNALGNTDEDNAIWAKYGINYTDIDLTTDFIVDVRHTDSSVSSGAPFVDFAKDPHFVNSNNQCADVTGGVVAAGSAQAAKLDELYTKAGDKRLVIICYGGMTMAKRAMQHFNAKGDVALGPEGKVTYLIGGSNAVLNGPYKNNLGISTADIDTSKDVILDVRGETDFNSGHLAGAVGADLMNNTADAKSAVLNDALASVPEGGKLVIVCYQGKGLAYKAMEYYMKNASDEDLQKVAYLIGGASTSENYGVFTGEEKARTMEVRIDMTKYPKGEVVRTWIPVPQSDEYQTISNEAFWANKAKVAEFKTAQSGEFTNKMLYVEWGADAEPADRTACLKYDAKRVLVSNNGIVVATNDTEFPAEVQQYITKTSKYVQIDGIVKAKADEITEGKTTTYDKARAIYEWVIGNLERIDNNETLECREGSPEATHTFKIVGCGYGDTKTILSDLDTYGRAGGHCTDINSVFVALCRASGIPAREMFGIRMSDDATGGQHCWAEFYQPGTGWVFADPGDVCKFGVKNNKSNVNMTIAQLEEARQSENTKKYTKEFWGGVDNNRVVLSRGRDVTLEPAQTGEAYNTFGYPCAEHNGVRIECTDAKNFVYTIVSEPYGTAISPAPAVAPAAVAPAEILDLPAVKITKPKAAKKSLTVKWKKVSKKNQKKIKGIQIQVATDPDFKNIVKTVKASKKKTSKKVSGLKKKTKYYVRIRAYGKENHYSVWKSKKTKTK